MSEAGPLITERADRLLAKVGSLARFTARTIAWAPRPPLYLKETLSRCFDIGVKTLPLVTLTGAITGVVFTQQSRPSLAAFGATSWLPSLIVIAIIRSLAPLVTALICAGKVGSSIGAELGSMRVTEQIDAMEVSAVNPIEYLVVTRTLATTLMVPVLTMYFGFVAMLGAFLNVRANEGTSWPAFVQSGFETITALDVWSGVAKAVIFGFTIGILACFTGYHASKGTRGVGIAANTAVVQAMLLIFLEEIVIVQVITFLRALG